MDIRLRYLSALKSSISRKQSATLARKIIGQELMEWILFREYLDPAADMDSIAGRLEVPREDVSELLWTCTGERFLTIRKRLRIGDAKELLLSRPDMSMSQVARTVGFQDKSDFRRAFREETGCLPRIWRESRGKWLKCRIRAVREAGRNRCHELHKSA
ncbi:MAG: AraC family transcriptional regulator [Bacteroidales bacterium]|nr:AraC family transcriptional regulator [Bacteroidales bacterium]